MNARSALFDLYGDHLRSRGGQARISCLVRLLAPLGIAAPAVRTAVSRMVRQGWLDAVRIQGSPGYTTTPRAERRLHDAAERIYRTRVIVDWDGHWHLVVPDRLPERSARERLRSGLAFLGYAPIADDTWVAARESPELDALLDAERVHAEQFFARHSGNAAALVRRAWDLDAVGRAYQRWLDDARAMVQQQSTIPSDEEAFALRSRVVHEWRKFLFTDPALPRELLPSDWPGDAAAEFFNTEAARLLPASARFVDSCLST